MLELFYIRKVTQQSTTASCTISRKPQQQLNSRSHSTPFLRSIWRRFLADRSGIFIRYRGGIAGSEGGRLRHKPLLGIGKPLKAIAAFRRS